MKYTLSANQIAAKHLGLIDKVDIVDLCLFDAFKSFANSKRCEKRIDEGGVWFWISYSEIIEDAPLLKIKTKDGIYRRMLKLQDARIIVFHPNNQKLGKTFFQWGENYDAMERKDWPDTPTDEKPKVENLRMKNRAPTDEKPNTYGLKTEPPTDEKPNNQYTNNQDTNQGGAHSQNPETLEAEKKEKKALLGAGPGGAANPTHLIKTTGPENPGMIEAEGITLPEIPCNPIDVPLTRDQCPMPRNSAALKESIRNYLVANANEWQHGILDATGAAKWDDERIGLCIDKFCESQEENGNLLASFGEYMELLKSWFAKEAKPKRAHIQTRVETPDEAASQIFDWVNGDGDGTVKNWYSQAYRKYTESDVNALVVRFCGVFLSHKEASIREQMELDPLKFFKKRFQLFVVDQKAHDRNTNTTYAPTNQKANLNRLGSDAAAYREKPLF